jgi:hypothetical protein
LVSLIQPSNASCMSNSDEWTNPCLKNSNPKTPINLSVDLAINSLTLVHELNEVKFELVKWVKLELYIVDSSTCFWFMNRLAAKLWRVDELTNFLNCLFVSFFLCYLWTFCDFLWWIVCYFVPLFISNHEIHK